VKQEELQNSESEDDSMFYLFSILLNSLHVHHFKYVGQLDLGLVRRTYDDDAYTFIHLSQY
jgi:hypothetical protein